MSSYLYLPKEAAWHSHVGRINSVRSVESQLNILKEVARTGEKADLAAPKAQCKAIISSWMKEKKLDETRKLDKPLADMPMTKQCTIHHIMKGEVSG